MNHKIIQHKAYDPHPGKGGQHPQMCKLHSIDLRNQLSTREVHEWEFSVISVCTGLLSV
jgi:hypothetical protein